MKNPPTILNYNDSFDYASRCVMAMLQSVRENNTQLNGDAVLSVLFTTAWGMALGAGFDDAAMLTKFMIAKEVIDGAQGHSGDDDSTGRSGGLPSTGTEEGPDDEYCGSGGDC